LNARHLEAVQSIFEPLILPTARLAVHPGKELIRGEVNAAGWLKPLPFGFDPLRYGIDEQILIVDRGNAVFTTAGDADRFSLTRPGIHILVLNGLSSSGCQAEPATRHQINLVFGSDVSRGRYEPFQVLMFFDPTLNHPAHALRHTMIDLKKQYRQSSDLGAGFIRTFQPSSDQQPFESSCQRPYRQSSDQPTSGQRLCYRHFNDPASSEQRPEQLSSPHWLRFSVSLNLT